MFQSTPSVEGSEFIISIKMVEIDHFCHRTFIQALQNPCCICFPPHHATSAFLMAIMQIRDNLETELSQHRPQQGLLACNPVPFPPVPRARAVWRAPETRQDEVPRINLSSIWIQISGSLPKSTKKRNRTERLGVKLFHLILCLSFICSHWEGC